MVEVHRWPILKNLWGGEFPCDKEGSPEKLLLLLDEGFDVFIDLTTEADGLTPYTDYAPHEHEYGRYPIPDNGVVDMAVYETIVENINLYLTDGRKIYLHCWGGIGRTGTVAGCVIADILSPMINVENIFRGIDNARMGTSKAHFPAPATEEQRNIVRQFAANVKERAT